MSSGEKPPLDDFPSDGEDVDLKQKEKELLDGDEGDESGEKSMETGGGAADGATGGGGDPPPGHQRPHSLDQIFWEREEQQRRRQHLKSLPQHQSGKTKRHADTHPWRLRQQKIRRHNFFQKQ
jgi:hypothetical protein